MCKTLLTTYHEDGVKFEESIMECFMELYEKKTGNDIREDEHSVQNLFLEVQKTLWNLHRDQITRLYDESSFGLTIFAKTLARDKFEEWSKVSSFSPPYTPSTPSRAKKCIEP